MRNYHRWFGAPAALFFVWLALTGLALQLDLWIRGQAPPGTEQPAGPPPAIPLPDDATLTKMVATSTQAFRAARPAGSVHSFQMTFGPNPKAVFASGPGAESPRVEIDPRSGAVIPTLPRPANYHNLLQNLHAGYQFGLAGRLISVALGLSLLVLSVTGFTVYLDMLKRRRKAGKKAVFWR